LVSQSRTAIAARRHKRRGVRAPLNTRRNPVSAFEMAAATIRREHHTLGLVIEMLQRLLADIEREYAKPDFSLLAAALYYVDDFPERCHHPKEDEYWFEALRRRTARFNAVLDELQAEHVLSTQTNGHLQRALVHYQGGAPEGLKAFKEAVDAYAVMLRDHMHAEEELLEQTRACLTEADWRKIAAAFDANDDPLFGANRREEFRRLYLRIVNRLPSKMRLQLQRHGRDQ
jgi:hemerythrin-like domain-containing protein